MWNERFKGSIINCKNAEVREEAENLFGEEMTAEEVMDHLNQTEEVISIENGAWEQGANPVVDYYVWIQLFLADKVVKNKINIFLILKRLKISFFK